jgi:transcriptional regulator with XRE-family HTH domain
MEQRVGAVAVLQARLQEVRAVRGLSADLARRADVDPSTVSEWITGKYFTGFDKLPHIAAVLGLTLEEFFDLSRPAVPSLKGLVHDLSSASVSPPSGDQDWIADSIVALVAPLDAQTRAQVLARALSEIVKGVTAQQSSARPGTRRDPVGALHAPRHRTA